MGNPNLIIFKFKILYEILKELENYVDFKIIEASHEKELEEIKIISKNSLIITKKKIEGSDVQFVLEKLPIKILQLLEKVNVKLIKSQFNQKSELDIGKYKLDLNSRVLSEENTKLKLTEKEIDIITFLQSSNDAISIDQLQSKVWGYNSELETHTVETHIYRLRKKILDKFNDNNFIQSKKNGYQIK